MSTRTGDMRVVRVEKSLLIVKASHLTFKMILKKNGFLIMFRMTMKMEPLCITPTGLKSTMILICRILMTLLVRLMCRYVKRARYHVNCFVG